MPSTTFFPRVFAERGERPFELVALFVLVLVARASTKSPGAARRARHPNPGASAASILSSGPAVLVVRDHRDELVRAPFGLLPAMNVVFADRTSGRERSGGHRLRALRRRRSRIAPTPLGRAPSAATFNGRRAPGFPAAAFAHMLAAPSFLWGSRTPGALGPRALRERARTACRDSRCYAEAPVIPKRLERQSRASLAPSRANRRAIPTNTPQKRASYGRAAHRFRTS